MAEARILTTDAEIDAAIERSKIHDNDPVARRVEHLPDANLLLIHLSNGRRLALPVEDLQGLGEATPEQLAFVEISSLGTGVRFPELDVDLYVPALINGVYGSERWMRDLNARGGSSREAA